MAKFLVNLGSQVTVEAADETEAINLAKTSPELVYFHVQTQKILDRETFVPDESPIEPV